MKVAIVGAGIAGLTAALALSSRADEIVLLESRTGFGEPGAGIQLSPNASRCLIALGLEPALRRVAVEPESIRVRALRDGREIGRIALGRALAERHGAPYLQIARADLHTILLDAVRARPGIRLLMGRHATVSDTGELAVERSAGVREVVEADLVVGADGVGSRIRVAVGDARAPAYSGYGAARAVVATAEATSEGGLWLGAGRHVVHYPIGAGRVNLVVVERRPRPVEGWSAPEEADAIRARFANAPRPVRTLIDAAESWAVWSLLERPVGVVAAGRTVLIGDAAHPVLPYLAQGGALAIEDAAELARCLAEAPVEPALVRFATVRRPRVEAVQRAAKRNGVAYHARGPVAWGRDLVMRREGPEGLARRYDWIYGWRPTA